MKNLVGSPYAVLLLSLLLPVWPVGSALAQASAAGQSSLPVVFSQPGLTLASLNRFDTSAFSEDASSSFGVVGGTSAIAAAFGQTTTAAVVHHGFRAFSRMAVGAQISPLGPGGELAVNLNRHLDARVTGNYIDYSTSFTTQGFHVNADLHLASAGASLDYYPFHNGFRLSPGIQVYNRNRVNAFGPVTPGESFELNDQTFYAAYPNAALGITALSARGGLNLHQTRPAFTATTGWGSLIPRSGRHWAIPFEIGAALSGTPKLNANLTGWACYDQAQTLCTNVADPTNPISAEIQDDLNAQIATWQKDINPLKVYPIISTGIVFNFNIRR